MEHPILNDKNSPPTDDHIFSVIGDAALPWQQLNGEDFENVRKLIDLKLQNE